MNAAVVHAFDVPPRYTSFAEPVAADGEVLVDVIAAGLHPIVKALANGSHYGSTGKLPFIPGVDGVGRQQDGTQIYFGSSRGPFGTFSERALAPRQMCVPVPEGLDAVTIAGMANPGMSSWVALTRRAKFVVGENILILGATGVAGQLAVQIARHLGAQRIVAAGRNREALRSSAIELIGSGLGSASIDEISRRCRILSGCSEIVPENQHKASSAARRGSALEFSRTRRPVGFSAGIASGLINASRLCNCIRTGGAFLKRLPIRQD